MRNAGLVATLILIAACPRPVEARPLRVLSLDQCADQYALALAPDARLALSPRADDPDSWLRAASTRHRRVRPTLEAAVGFQPDVVIRSWGGEPRLLAALRTRGIRTIQLDDATDMAGVAASIRSVAAQLNRPERGEALVAGMETRLAEAGRGGARGSALYLTAGGFTAGRGTLMDAILSAAKFDNLTTFSGFGPVSVERIALSPPTRFVLGFFDQARADWRGAGRHPVITRATTTRASARLPAAVLACPAWFAADAAASLAAQAR